MSNWSLLQGHPQAVEEQHALEGALAHLRGEEAVGVLALLLGAVHREVGVAQQVVGVDPVLGIDADAGARAQDDLVVVGPARLGEAVEKPARHERGVVGAGEVLHEHDELVTPDARDEVGAAGPGSQPLGHRLQDGVAGGVAEPVVDRLEAVEVEKDERTARPLASGAGERALQGVEEERAVGQPGEAVVAREALELRLRALPLQEEGEEAADVGEGRDPFLVPRPGALAPHLEHPEHLAAHPDRDGEGHAGAALRRPVPRRRLLLEGAQGERVGGRGGDDRRAGARRRPAEDGRGRIALRHPEPGLAAVQAVDEGVEHGRGRLGQRERRGERLGRALAGHGQALAPPAVGQVADVRAEDDAPLDVRGHHHGLDRHQRPVGPHGGRLAAAPEVGAVAGPDEVAQPAPHLVAQRRRDDGIRHLAPEDLGAAVAEEAPGRGVELDDPPLVVGGEDAVEGGVEDECLSDLARPQLLLPLARLLEGTHGERQDRGRGARTVRLRAALHEGGDPLAGVAPVDQELHPDPEEAGLLSGQANDLADHPHGRGGAGEVEGEADLGAELELPRALEEDASSADVEDRALVLVGVAHEARPVPQAHREALVAAGGHAQQLLQAAVPQKGVHGDGDDRVGSRDRELGLGFGRLRPVEPDDRGGPGHLVLAELSHERGGLRPGYVDDHHVGAGPLGGPHRPGGVLDVLSIDVRPPEDGGPEHSGEVLRADDQDLEHVGGV